MAPSAVQQADVTHTVAVYRDCPRCGAEAASIYPPKVWDQRPGQKRMYHQAYCSTCKKTYSLRLAKTPVVPLVPRLTTKVGARKSIPSHTLADILATPEPWLDCYGEGTQHRWRHLRLLILERDEHRCRIGGRRCAIDATEVDHIKRRIDGGTSHPDNLRAACGPCNSRGNAPRARVCHDCGSLNVHPIA